MGRFPLFKRLLLVIILWPGKLAAGNGIRSQTEAERNGCNVMDEVPAGSPYYNYELQNVMFHQMEKVAVTFPDCDSDLVGKKTAPSMTEIVEKLQQIEVTESGCQIPAYLSELRNIAEGLFSGGVSESCVPSWDRITASNLWGNGPAVFRSYNGTGRNTSVEVQHGRDGNWTDASQSKITGRDVRYRLNITAGDGPNGTFALVILVDHFVLVLGSPANASNETEGAVAGLVRPDSGLLMFRVYEPPEIGTTNEISNLETTGRKFTKTLDLKKCNDNDVFVVEEFFKDIENELRAAATLTSTTTPATTTAVTTPTTTTAVTTPTTTTAVTTPATTLTTSSTTPTTSPTTTPKPEESGVASSPGMICLYVLLILTVLSVGGIFLVKWIKKSGRGNLCGRFTLPFHY